MQQSQSGKNGNRVKKEHTTIVFAWMRILSFFLVCFILVLPICSCEYCRSINQSRCVESARIHFAIAAKMATASKKKIQRSSLLWCVSYLCLLFVLF
jgi:hypothetical protein